MDTSVLIARLTPPKLVYILNNCGCLNAYRQSESGKSYQTYLNYVYLNQREETFESILLLVERLARLMNYTLCISLRLKKNQIKL